jgi:acyl-CoA synthetase (AMP-forming)/AMP-acid ligase II
VINIGQFLAKRAERAPDQEGLVFGSTRLSYRQLNGEANRVAHALAGLGVGKGDRVGVLLMNSPRFCQLYFGLAKLGAVLVTLNWRLAPPELEWICANAGVSTLLFEREFLPAAEALRGHSAAGRYVAVDGPAPSWAAGLDGLAALMTDAEPALEGADDDPLLIMYTSGTTGRPRGAVITHANVFWGSVTVALTLDFRIRDRVLIVMPLYHIGALDYLTICVHRGCTAILMRAFEPRAMLETIRGERVDTFLAVAAMLQALREVPGFDEAVASVRWLLCGAAPVPVPLIEEYARRGITIQQSYGLTETTGPAAVLGPERAREKAGSTGTAFFHTEIRVVDEAGRDVPPRQVGEVLVRGAHVIREYWQDPEGTAEALRHGWLRTGDLAWQDDEGFLYIADRKKDMIISGGENIYPAEVESVLSGHPGIAEAAVIGVPDARWGEAPRAIVVPRAGAALGAEEVLAFCQGKLARYKIPRSVVISAEPLPRNPTGKILKRVLRERHGAKEP